MKAVRDMAKAEINIPIRFDVNKSLASVCLALLETYMNQNPNIDVIGHRGDDGTISLEFTERILNRKEESSNESHAD